MTRSASVGIAAVAFASSALALAPLTEDFESGLAGWTEDDGQLAASIATEPGNAFARAVRPIPADPGGPFPGSATILELEVPGSDFAGNYLAAGIDTLTFDVRHDANIPLTFGVRLAVPGNFPAVLAPIDVAFTPVFAGPGFTTLTFDLSPAALVTTGTPAESILSDVQNIQLFANLGAVGASGDVTFDIDNIAIVPAPSAAALLAAGALAAARRRRA